MSGEASPEDTVNPLSARIVGIDTQSATKRLRVADEAERSPQSAALVAKYSFTGAMDPLQLPEAHGQNQHGSYARNSTVLPRNLGVNISPGGDHMLSDEYAGFLTRSLKVVAEGHTTHSLTDNYQDNHYNGSRASESGNATTSASQTKSRSSEAGSPPTQTIAGHPRPPSTASAAAAAVADAKLSGGTRMPPPGQVPSHTANSNSAVAIPRTVPTQHASPGQPIGSPPMATSALVAANSFQTMQRLMSPPPPQPQSALPMASPMITNASAAQNDLRRASVVSMPYSLQAHGAPPGALQQRVGSTGPHQQQQQQQYPPSIARPQTMPANYGTPGMLPANPAELALHGAPGNFNHAAAAVAAAASGMVPGRNLGHAMANPAGFAHNQQQQQQQKQHHMQNFMAMPGIDQAGGTQQALAHSTPTPVHSGFQSPVDQQKFGTHQWQRQLLPQNNSAANPAQRRVDEGADGSSSQQNMAMSSPMPTPKHPPSLPGSHVSLPGKSSSTPTISNAPAPVGIGAAGTLTSPTSSAPSAPKKAPVKPKAKRMTKKASAKAAASNASAPVSSKALDSAASPHLAKQAAINNSGSSSKTNGSPALTKASSAAALVSSGNMHPAAATPSPSFSTIATTGVAATAALMSSNTNGMSLGPGLNASISDAESQINSITENAFSTLLSQRGNQAGIIQGGGVDLASAMGMNVEDLGLQLSGWFNDGPSAEALSEILNMGNIGAGSASTASNAAGEGQHGGASGVDGNQMLAYNINDPTAAFSGFINGGAPGAGGGNGSGVSVAAAAGLSSSLSMAMPIPITMAMAAPPVSSSNAAGNGGGGGGLNVDGSGSSAGMFSPTTATSNHNL
ncbi:hypothetical protein LPJ53_002654 [Coemansia erecta]|uniref:Uncharacterized protein n=1 Tax=Coemansia erecta TaxID=147472 RepID=A0A9W7Y2G3_9FUNG|nr:hypothetical protein LPJ53_002654 [Coemansia erecta]